jgi:hypothetical protein
MVCIKRHRINWCMSVTQIIEQQSGASAVLLRRAAAELIRTQHEQRNRSRHLFSRIVCHTSQPPPISNRPATTKSTTLRATSPADSIQRKPQEVTRSQGFYTPKKLYLKLMQPIDATDLTRTMATHDLRSRPAKEAAKVKVLQIEPVRHFAG